MTTPLLLRTREFTFSQVVACLAIFIAWLKLLIRLLSAMSLVSVFVPNRLHWLHYMIWLVFFVIVVGLVTWDLFFRRLSQWLYKKNYNGDA
ncbi:hypothetical protein ACSBR2_004864 [Camellia fascicularis]